MLPPRRKTMPAMALEGSLFGSAPVLKTQADAGNPSAESMLDRAREWLDAACAPFLRQRPLRITVGGKRLCFHTVTDFEFALASRTEFPIAKVDELMQLSPEKLKRAAVSIRDVEHRLMHLYTEAMDSPGMTGAALASVELKLFSQDHRWREIMERLGAKSVAFEPYKRVAFAKYLQYLRSRQAVVQSIYHEKAGGGPDPDLDATGVHSETSIFESLLGHEEQAKSFQPLPRGETVRIKLARGKEMELMLSRHPFLLLGGKRLRLRDASGAEYELAPGKNFVGREAGNDVVVDASYRAVSRRHLIVEPVGEDGALLTDLSSHGTFVPPQCVV